MALAETTLAAAVAATDKTITVASATSMAPGRLIRIGEEEMRVTKEYSSGVIIPVLRGVGGTIGIAHTTSARVVHGNGEDFGVSAAQAVGSPMKGMTRRVVNIVASSTAPLPASPGEKLVLVLNGTAINTVTVPVPTKDLDLAELMIINSGAAAHLVTFTGGLSGAGSSYDILTFNATGQTCFEFVAMNEVWVAKAAVPMAGTVTNLTGTIA